MFSWIIDDKLAVGPAPRTYHLLLRRGFTAALSLQEDSEPGPSRAEIPPGFILERVPIRDGVIGGKPTEGQLQDAVDRLHRLLGRNTVYVHCFAGVGRSPLVCVAYLARYCLMSFQDAMLHVSQRHPNTAPTEGQLETLYRYLEHIAREQD